MWNNRCIILRLILKLVGAAPQELQRKQSDAAARRLLQALRLGPDDSPVGRLIAGCCSPSNSHTRLLLSHTAQGPAGSLGRVSQAEIAAAAALLPSLTWQWLSVADLDGWVDRGVVHLLRETLLVQKAASDASVSINELVGWCLDNCSGPATALAALWGQQQAQDLPPRSRSFYGLMLQRLGLTEGPGPQPQPRPLAAGPGRTGPCPGAHLRLPAEGGSGVTALAAAAVGVVMCGSVTRTALPTPSRSRSSAEEVEDGEEEEEEEALRAGGEEGSEEHEGRVTGSGSSRRGGRGGSSNGRSGKDASEVSEPDLIILGEVPVAARALLEQSAAAGGAEQDAGMEPLPQQPLQQQLQGKQPRGGRRGNGAAAAAGDGVNGSSAVDGAAAAGSIVNGSEQTAVNGSGSAAATMTAPNSDSAEAAEATTADDGAAAPALDAAASGAVSRPTASLLQRPSRSPVAAPEPDLDQGAEDGTAASGAGAVGSLGWYFSGGAAGSQRSYSGLRLVAAGQFPLRDLSGAALEEGLEVPETGPIVISNDPRIFTGTESVLSDYSTPAGDKLAMRLEYVVDRYAYDEVVLQLFNISRVTRKRTENCLMYVNGKPVNVGDPGVGLAPGDEVWFGNRHFSFRVEALQGPPSAVRGALRRFCSGGDDDSTAADAAAAITAGFTSDDGETSSDEQTEAAGLSSSPRRSSSMSWTSTLSSEPDMAELSNLSRRDPLRAEAALRRLAAANPGDAAVWLIWAQTAARLVGPGWQAKARLLFRAAVESARRMEVIPPPPAALQVAAQRAFARGRGGGRRGAQPAGGGSAAASGDDVSSADAAPAAAAALPPPQRHNWLLVQALGNWGKHEWRLRMYGSARHLFRAAVDEAARHPDGVAGGGGAAILHYWASRELDALNVRNARIVAAEALRKCPADVALYVLAAGVELEGGNLELAKSYCQRAYSLDRTDKQLFLVWPRVEAALGDRLKARLLYERALDMYPLNTKILNLYARFEAEEGSYREAAELFDRALRIDPLSPVTGVHNRADWASLEADLGNMGLARGLLEGGLAAHPRSPPLLVTLAKVERLEGRYEEAFRLVRAAQAIAGPFNAAVMTERAQVLRALGERELAANLSRHVAAVKELHRMKQQGYWGSEAWRAYIEATRSSEQQALVAAARARKRALGWAPTARGAKPQPTGAAGDGRRPAAPEAQQWMQAEQLRLRRAEARRLAAQRAARMRELEAGGDGGAVGGGSMSSVDDEYGNEYDEPPVGVPSLDSVRRPMPYGDEDVYDT